MSREDLIIPRKSGCQQTEVKAAVLCRFQYRYLLELYRPLPFVAPFWS